MFIEEKKYWCPGSVTMTLDDWRKYIIDTMPYHSTWNTSIGREHLLSCSYVEFIYILKYDFNITLIEV